MPLIDTAALSDDDLSGYDWLMVQAAGARLQFAELPIRIWNDVLVELGRRGLVQALEGGLEDVTTARIKRSYPLPDLP
jgi:hypothetical protein